jgi:hypothetical protein
MFCAPGLIFGGTEGIASRFHLLRARTRFRRYRGRRVPLSCFTRPDSFSAVQRASGPVFRFFAPGLIFSRYRGRRVPFSYFVRPDSFSAVPRASGPVFMFCAPGLIFSGTEGVGSRFHVFHARTSFRWYRGRQVPFSWFALPDSFSAVPRASCTFFMFCAPEHIFGGTEGVGSRFHVLRPLTHFRQYRGRRVQFSRFARPDSFSAEPRASHPVFKFCAPGLDFGGTEGVESFFKFCAYGLVFCGTEGVHRTHFRRY